MDGHKIFWQVLWIYPYLGNIFFCHGSSLTFFLRYPRNAPFGQQGPLEVLFDLPRSGCWGSRPCQNTALGFKRSASLYQTVWSQTWGRDT